MTISKRAGGPSPYWYGVAGAIIALGLVAGLLLGVGGVRRSLDQIDGFERIPVPGREEVELEAGNWIIYAEGWWPQGSMVGQFNGVPIIEIFDEEGGQVPVNQVYPSYGESPDSYDLGGHHGVAIYDFHAVTSERYTIVTHGEPGMVDQLAIGRPAWGSLVVGVLAGSAVAGLGVLIGCGVLIATALGRAGAKRRAAVAARSSSVAPAPATGPPPPPPYAGWPGARW